MRPVAGVNVPESMKTGVAAVSRRRVLIGGAIMTAGMSLLRAASLVSNESKSQPHFAIAKGESMSHHLDSPIARQDVRLDITDLYVFRGQVGTAFVINVCHSLGTPKIPGYHPEGMYEFKVDLNGDAVEEVTYRLTFDERDAQDS